jgi:flavin-dependent dehydrogenase
MRKQKVAIIGAGVCGLYLGWKLSEKGHSVVIFEKNQKTEKKICSGLFSERILDFIPQSRGLIQKSIQGTIIRFPKKTIKVEFSKKFYLIEHTSLVKLIENLARREGAIINFNRDIKTLELESFLIDNQRFDKIIGCDGADSFVRKKLNLSEIQYRLGILGFTDEEFDSNYVETWPCPDGFIWKIPRKTKTEYGIIAGAGEAKTIFEKFLKRNNIILKRIQARIIPQGLITPLSDSITVCGDAAGLTKPWSGGGVVWGLTAADILLKSFPDFLKYRRAMRKFFLPLIFLSKAAVKTIYFTGFKIPFLLPKRVKMESDFLI